MISLQGLRSRFRQRPQAFFPSASILALGGRIAEAELSRGCSGRLALCLPTYLLPEGGASRETKGVGREGFRARLVVVGRIILTALVVLHLFWIGTTSLIILSYKFIQPSATLLMADRAWVDGWKILRPRPLGLRVVPSWLRSMLVSVEDYKFYNHHGFDFDAIKRAYEINQRIDQPLHGGSTLTMQVARTLFLVPVKSYTRKYLEVIVAAELELLLSKDRILELYFGYAEWGKGIFGIDAASRKWYGTGVRGLTRDQGARLITVLSSPIKYRPEYFGRSLILQERYDYLYGRFVAPTETVSETAAPALEGQPPSSTESVVQPAVTPPVQTPVPESGPTTQTFSGGRGRRRPRKV